jgi:hypothetical protein
MKDLVTKIFKTVFDNGKDAQNAKYLSKKHKVATI